MLKGSAAGLEAREGGLLSEQPQGCTVKEVEVGNMKTIPPDVTAAGEEE